MKGIPENSMLLLQNYFEVVYYRKTKQQQPKKKNQKENLFSGLRNAEHQYKGKISIKQEISIALSSLLPPATPHPGLSLNMFH